MSLHYDLSDINSDFSLDFEINYPRLFNILYVNILSLVLFFKVSLEVFKANIKVKTKHFLKNNLKTNL